MTVKLRALELFLAAGLRLRPGEQLTVRARPSGAVDEILLTLGCSEVSWNRGEADSAALLEAAEQFLQQHDRAPSDFADARWELDQQLRRLRAPPENHVPTIFS